MDRVAAQRRPGELGSKTMKRYLASLIALILATGAAHAQQSTGSLSATNQLRGLAVSFLQRRASSREELLSSGVDGIRAVEDFLASRTHTDRETISTLVAQLGHKDYQVRQAATERLSYLPQSSLPVLLAADETDPEVRSRLKQVAGRIKSFDKRIPSLLRLLDTMYNTHAAHIVEQRLPLLMQNPDDMRAAYALSRVSFVRAWKLLEPKTDGVKLTYLLLRVYVGDSQDAREMLKTFSAAEILRVASVTWWPVEIEPIERDGAYGWTTRAQTVTGNTARNVMRLSVKMPNYGNVGERGEWVHLKQWSEITYVFRFPVHCSKSAVAFARWHRMPAELVDWMGAPGKKQGKTRSRCDTFRGLPATARLPMAHISGKESLDWHLGKTYKWAEPLFPKELAKELSFAADKYKAPDITEPSPLDAGDDR